MEFLIACSCSFYVKLMIFPFFLPKIIRFTSSSLGETPQVPAPLGPVWGSLPLPSRIRLPPLFGAGVFMWPCLLFGILEFGLLASLFLAPPFFLFGPHDYLFVSFLRPAPLGHFWVSIGLFLPFSLNTAPQSTKFLSFDLLT